MKRRTNMAKKNILMRRILHNRNIYWFVIPTIIGAMALLLIQAEQTIAMQEDIINTPIILTQEVKKTPTTKSTDPFQDVDLKEIQRLEKFKLKGMEFVMDIPDTKTPHISGY